MISGTLAASVTPLRDGGRSPDLTAVGRVVDFLAEGGVDGVLALGTTGEGILLDESERSAVAEAFLSAARGRLDVAVHVGGMTTAESERLARHAAAEGAAAVAAIGPPYYAYDEDALVEHFAAIGRACAPTSFYLYEFEARAGYALPIRAIARLRAELDNLRGIKVSTTPWEKFEPYLDVGLDVFAGPEPLISDSLARGGVGAVSGLASAFPELVSAHVREPTVAGQTRLSELRAALSRFPLQAALKQVLVARGVEFEPSVRRPLRPLTDSERRDVDEFVAAQNL
ncbi:MAG: dihydrodipicolinate synthase family protein [Gaiellaceae bacterium]